MYKVIIVDNEKAVRERLLAQLDKLKDEFEVIGEYENGFDAYAVYELPGLRYPGGNPAGAAAAPEGEIPHRAAAGRSISRKAPAVF